MSAVTSHVDKTHDTRFSNHILSALPRAEYEDLLPALRRVRLSRGTVLHEAGGIIQDCFFPTSGTVSLLGTTLEGDDVEVGLVGKEGMAGVHAILNARTVPYRVMAQADAEGLLIKAHALQERAGRGGALHALLLRYTHALLCQVSQSVICNRFHVVEKRLCRRLLVNGDRAQSDTFRLTQEGLSQMLGVPRTNVTMTLGALQRRNLIRYKRGEISIVNRPAMETAVCECYQAVKYEVN